jgi:hypothetical protein
MGLWRWIREKATVEERIHPATLRLVALVQFLILWK